MTGGKSMVYDVIIIGGGVIGCAAARFLTKYRGRFLLLEKTNDICNGQSKANTAIVHGGYDAKPGTLKAKFNVLGNAMFDALSKELDFPLAWNTSLVVSFSEDGHGALERLREQGVRNGCRGELRIIPEAELRAREPHVGKDAKEALLVGAGGICCPYEMTVALAENAAENGAEFRRNTAVESVEKTPEGWAVRTSAGVLSARAVVNAAGVYSDVFHNMASAHKVKITPRKGEYHITDKKYAGTFTASMFQLPTKMGKGTLIAPTVDGTILVGPTAEDIEDRDDKRTTAEGLSKALRAGRLTWNDMPPSKGFITAFTGVRATGDTGDFILGEPDDAENWFDCCAVESPGLTSAPAIGEYIARSVAEKLSLPVNGAFDPRRQGIRKFRLMSDAEREKAIAENPDYAKLVCRCEQVTEAEIREAIRRPVGALDLDGVKRRTRAGMGRCQAGFCTPRVMEILSEELGTPLAEITKNGGRSRLIAGSVFPEAEA